MKSITTTGSKSQKPQASINLRINQLSERLRNAKSQDESKELLASFIEATEESAVKIWLLEFQRIFQSLDFEAIDQQHARNSQTLAIGSNAGTKRGQQ